MLYEIDTVDACPSPTDILMSCLQAQTSTTTMMIDSGLIPDQTRDYRVRARNSYGYGPWSETKTATTDPTAPALLLAPYNSGGGTARGRTRVSMHFAWAEARPNGFPVIGYRAEVSSAGGSGVWSGGEIGMNG